MSEKLLRQSSLKQQTRPSARRRNRHVLINLPHNDDRPYKTKTKILIGALIVLIIISAVSGYLIGGADYAASKRTWEPPDTEGPLKPSPSVLHTFERAAVCTDAPACSEIGRRMLIENGSAVDAAIAAMFCNGLLNQQSMGIGGGFFMTVYIKNEEKAYSVIAREKAPKAAKCDMFKGNADKASTGPLSVGVPGELRGMWVAHQRWGRLPWQRLVLPAIKLCREGYPLSKALHSGLESAPRIKNDPILRRMYLDRSTGNWYKIGTIVRPSDGLCTTFERIAQKGGDDFYNGSLADDFLEDLKKVGSIITAEDLRDYEAKITEPITVPLSGGDILYTPPPPSSGVILANILNILRGYNFNSNSINTTEDKILTYHRIIEAFKFAYAARTKLGDEDFLDLKEFIKNVTSSTYARDIRLRINDYMTSNDTATYGVTEYSQPDAGTAHISIIGPDGDAVSVTSSVNFYFGANFATENTGIVMNNVMDDFSSPGITNYFGLKPSPPNFIAPGKRPLSSMTPSIIVDMNRNAKLVIGASGGTKITTAVALVTMRKLWFGQTIKEAVDEPRIHHQIFPMTVAYEYGVLADIVEGLRAKGHGLVRYRDRGSIVCALFRNSTAIYANADWRKYGDVAGLN